MRSVFVGEHGEVVAVGSGFFGFDLEWFVKVIIFSFHDHRRGETLGVEHVVEGSGAGLFLSLEILSVEGFHSVAEFELDFVPRVFRVDLGPKPVLFDA